jgi:hypothetical protein
VMRSASTMEREHGERTRVTGITGDSKWTSALLELTADGSLRITAYPTSGDQPRSYSLRLEDGNIAAGTPGPTRREPAG